MLRFYFTNFTQADAHRCSSDPNIDAYLFVSIQAAAAPPRRSFSSPFNSYTPAVGQPVAVDAGPGSSTVDWDAVDASYASCEGLGLANMPEMAEVFDLTGE